MCARPRILCAPDKLAGSASATEAAWALVAGVHAAGLEADALPIGDGGPGTLEALALPILARLPCRGPLGAPATGRLGMLPGGPLPGGLLPGGLQPDGAVFLESADACGLHVDRRRQPLRAHSRGAGTLLLQALERAPRVVVGLGGTATADGGAGLAAALGVVLLDRAGRRLSPHPAGLLRLAKVELPDLSAWRGRVEAWCDVLVPLLPAGPLGVPAGPRDPVTGLSFLRQKGVRDVELVRRAWACWLDALAAAGLPLDPSLPGSGAAGGLGLVLHGLLGAPLRGGADAVLDALGFEARLERVDHVFTAEGRFDSQSLAGKGPGRVMARALASGLPVTVLAGSVEPGVDARVGDHVRLVEIGDPALPLPEQLRQGPARLQEAARLAARAVPPAPE